MYEGGRVAKEFIRIEPNFWHSAKTERNSERGYRQTLARSLSHMWEHGWPVRATRPSSNDINDIHSQAICISDIHMQSTARPSWATIDGHQNNFATPFSIPDLRASRHKNNCEHLTHSKHTLYNSSAMMQKWIYVCVYALTLTIDKNCHRKEHFCGNLLALSCCSISSDFALHNPAVITDIQTVQCWTLKTRDRENRHLGRTISCLHMNNYNSVPYNSLLLAYTAHFLIECNVSQTSRQLRLLRLKVQCKIISRDISKCSTVIFPFSLQWNHEFTITIPKRVQKHQ